MSRSVDRSGFDPEVSVSRFEALKKSRRPKVLVIDDSVESIRLTSFILEHFNCDITMAFDGENSLPLLLGDRFDLVVLDWMMPNLNGGQVLESMERLLTRRGRLKHETPVLIYSGVDLHDMDIPNTEYFAIKGHLSKTMPYSNLIKTFSRVMDEITR